MGAKIIQGDCRRILATLPADSFHCVVTSPPYYGQRTYLTDESSEESLELGKEDSVDAYVLNLVCVFRELRRVLRPDGTVWLNLGDCYAGSGGPGGDFRDGTGGDTYCRQYKRKGSGLKPKDLCGVPWRTALALQADGWYLRSECVWAKGLSFCPSYVGTAVPRHAKDRPTTTHEHVFLLSKSRTYYYDSDAVSEVSIDGQSKRRLRSVWVIRPSNYGGAHFAMFPPALVEPCIKAGCPLDGVVLDPFAGSGTTLAVAVLLGRNAVGIELNKSYITLIEQRLAQTTVVDTKQGESYDKDSSCSG